MPIVYALSVGPAYCAVNSGIFSQRAFAVLYAPLAWLANRSPFFNYVIDWCIGLWVETP